MQGRSLPLFIKWLVIIMIIRKLPCGDEVNDSLLMLPVCGLGVDTSHVITINTQLCICRHN